MHPRGLTVANRLVKHEYHGQVWFTVEAANAKQQKSFVEVDRVQDRTSTARTQQP
jgi:hypothetical protein